MAYNENKLYKILDYWFRDIPNFDFLEWGLGKVSPPRFVNEFSKKCFWCYILLTNQSSLPDCLYFLRYWSILQLFVIQVLTSQLFKLTLSFQSRRFFSTSPKSQDKNVSTLRTRRAFKVKPKAFFIIVQRL